MTPTITPDEPEFTIRFKADKGQWVARFRDGRSAVASTPQLAISTLVDCLLDGVLDEMAGGKK